MPPAEPEFLLEKREALVRDLRKEFFGNEEAKFKPLKFHVVAGDILSGFEMERTGIKDHVENLIKPALDKEDAESLVNRRDSVLLLLAFYGKIAKDKGQRRKPEALPRKILDVLKSSEDEPFPRELRAGRGALIKDLERYLGAQR